MVLDLGKGFTPRFGNVTEQMPLLRVAGEMPISMDHALEQQFAHPETWGKTYVFTGDAALTGIGGDVLIELDSLLLLSMDKNSVLSNHALVLSQDQWEERIGNLENLHLSPDKVAQAEGKGCWAKEMVFGSQKIELLQKCGMRWEEEKIFKIMLNLLFTTQMALNEL